MCTPPSISVRMFLRCFEYEYKGRMRRDEIALDMARMLRDYQETLEANYFEDQKVLLETCSALTDKNHDVSMKLSGFRTDLNSKNRERSSAIWNEYHNAEKDYWKKQNERSHRPGMIPFFTTISSFTLSCKHSGCTVCLTHHFPLPFDKLSFRLGAVSPDFGQHPEYRFGSAAPHPDKPRIFPFFIP